MPFYMVPFRNSFHVVGAGFTDDSHPNNVCKLAETSSLCAGSLSKFLHSNHGIYWIKTNFSFLIFLQLTAILYVLIYVAVLLVRGIDMEAILALIKHL